MVREIEVQSQVESFQRQKKLSLDVPFLNTQHYKVRSALPLHLGIVAIEKDPSGRLT